MKKAKVEVAAVYADCPECGGELIDQHTGAYLIYTDRKDTSYEYLCDTCGKTWRLEAKAYK